MRCSASAVVVVLAALASAACSSASDQSPQVAAAITPVQGDAQADTVGATLSTVLSVKVTDQGGQPVPGVAVAWTATSGFVSAGDGKTDGSGVDTARWTLGGTPGPATATATVNGLSATFHATAGTGHPAVLFYSGDGQSAPAGTVLPAPLLVRVTDTFANPLAGVAVTWTVSGGGSLSATTQTTDSQGQAQVTWTLGPAAGPQQVTATAGGVTRTFSATAS